MDLMKIAEVLSKVRGVQGVALGGSRSRDEAGLHSDFDIGLYYEPDKIDLVTLGQVLKELDDEDREGLLNPPGAWGPWINGGAWLRVDGMPVDILLRDVQKVEKVIKDCQAGTITIDYQCGHPFGFVNAIYAAETHYCRPLWQDEAAALDKLKAVLYSEGEYSPRMREAMINKFLWEAWFSLECGRKAALKGDFNYVMGSFFRAVCSWVEVLYALNDRYLMNEKAALKQVVNLEHKPIDFEPRVKSAYKLLADDGVEEAYRMMDNLHGEVVSLTAERSPMGT